MRYFGGGNESLKGMEKKSTSYVYLFEFLDPARLIDPERVARWLRENPVVACPTGRYDFHGCSCRLGHFRQPAHRPPRRRLPRLFRPAPDRVCSTGTPAASGTLESGCRWWHHKNPPAR